MMRLYIIACTVFIATISVTARDKVVREGKIITTTQDTITGLVDISTDFNFQVYYKTDVTKRRFKKIKSKNVASILYDDKVFERIPYKSKHLIALKIVAGKVSLYADFLPSITPGNNSSMLSSVQTSKTRKIFYLLHNGETNPVSSRNYQEVLKMVFEDEPEFYKQMGELTYAEVLDSLPDWVLKYNEL